MAQMDKRIVQMVDAAAAARILELLEDQANWRKGVELIASALGEHDPPNLCCVRIAEVAFQMRADVERLEAEIASLKEIIAGQRKTLDAYYYIGSGSTKYKRQEHDAYLRRREEARAMVSVKDKPIEDVLRSIVAEVPKSEWDKLPKGLTNEKEES